MKTKIQISVSIGPGCKKVDYIEFDTEELEGMTPDQAEKYQTELAMEHLLQLMVNWDWRVVE